MHNGTTDIVVDAPNVAQSSPGLMIPSTAAGDSLTNGSYNTLQGKTSLMDDHNTLPSVPNEYVEDPVWNMKVDQNDINNLPPLPPTDTRDIQGYNALSWPLLTTDTDWQFDLDIPLTADTINTSTAPSSTALTDLDMSPMYSRSTHSFDSTASSAELIASLGLHDKVSTHILFLLFKGFLHLLTQARRSRQETF